jgi:hypothetical protein
VASDDALSASVVGSVAVILRRTFTEGPSGEFGATVDGENLTAAAGVALLRSGRAGR